MSRVRTIGQVWRVTRAETPGCLAMGKLGKQGIHPRGDLSFPNISLVMQLDPFPDPSSPSMSLVMW